MAGKFGVERDNYWLCNFVGCDDKWEKSMIQKTCHNCGIEWNGSVCQYGNIERILRLEKHEECPFWVPEHNVDMIKNCKHKKRLFKGSNICKRCGAYFHESS